jgi:serine/threonine protein kinase
LDTHDRIAATKLGDFGIAQDQQGSRTTMRQGMSHPGTPLYMAPEQSNSANILDVRADIYTLGITLWETLTGIDYKPLANESNRPDLRQYNPVTSPGIAAVIEKAVRNDPKQRYSTPQDMADDLKAVLGGKQPLNATSVASVVAVAPRGMTTVPAVYTPVSHRSRNGTIFAILAVIVLLGIGILILPRVLTQGGQSIGGNASGDVTSIPQESTASVVSPIISVPTSVSTVQVDIPTQPAAPTTAPTQPTIVPAQPTLALAPTSGSQIVSSTASGSILQPGETWYQDGMEMLVDNPTFIPGCQGVLGFEMTIVNNSGGELLANISGRDFAISDNIGQNYPASKVYWTQGSSSESCYSSSLEALNIRAMKPGERIDLAFRVVPIENQSSSQFHITIRKAGNIQNAAWKINN